MTNEPRPPAEKQHTINEFMMGVDICLWRARIGSFNHSVRQISRKRAKLSSRVTNKLEVAVVAAIALLILAGDLDYNQLQQRNSKCACVLAARAADMFVLNDIRYQDYCWVQHCNNRSVTSATIFIY